MYGIYYTIIYILYIYISVSYCCQDSPYSNTQYDWRGCVEFDGGVWLVWLGVVGSWLGVGWELVIFGKKLYKSISYE